MKKVFLCCLFIFNTVAFAYTSEIVDGYVKENGEVVQPYIRYRNDNNGFYNPKPVEPPKYNYNYGTYGY
ncbi:hypothetical protein [Campylobacter sp. CCS1377]|uniref:Uncharacterized protein n=1 Tax=Campylobacter sp. CCS1377 TaxID=3158229 RepID=A0AAU7E5F0_9BACT